MTRYCRTKAHRQVCGHCLKNFLFLLAAASSDSSRKCNPQGWKTPSHGHGPDMAMACHGEAMMPLGIWGSGHPVDVGLGVYQNHPNCHRYSAGIQTYPPHTPKETRSLSAYPLTSIRSIGPQWVPSGSPVNPRFQPRHDPVIDGQLEAGVQKMLGPLLIPQPIFMDPQVKAGQLWNLCPSRVDQNIL